MPARVSTHAVEEIWTVAGRSQVSEAQIAALFGERRARPRGDRRHRTGPSPSYPRRRDQLSERPGGGLPRPQHRGRPGTERAHRRGDARRDPYRGRAREIRRGVRARADRRPRTVRFHCPRDARADHRAGRLRPDVFTGEIGVAVVGARLDRGGDVDRRVPARGGRRHPGVRGVLGRIHPHGHQRCRPSRHHRTDRRRVHASRFARRRSWSAHPCGDFEQGRRRRHRRRAALAGAGWPTSAPDHRGCLRAVPKLRRSSKLKLLRPAGIRLSHAACRRR